MFFMLLERLSWGFIKYIERVKEKDIDVVNLFFFKGNK